MRVRVIFFFQVLLLTALFLIVFLICSMMCSFLRCHLWCTASLSGRTTPTRVLEPPLRTRCAYTGCMYFVVWSNLLPVHVRCSRTRAPLLGILVRLFASQTTCCATCPSTRSKSPFLRFLKLSRAYFQNTNDSSFINDDWNAAVAQIFKVIEEQSQPTFDEDFNLLSYVSGRSTLHDHAL